MKPGFNSPKNPKKIPKKSDLKFGKVNLKLGTFFYKLKKSNLA